MRPFEYISPHTRTQAISFDPGTVGLCIRRIIMHLPSLPSRRDIIGVSETALSAVALATALEIAAPGEITGGLAQPDHAALISFAGHHVHH